MRDITTDDFRFGTLVWGTVVALLLGSIIWGFILNDKHNHEFDVACITSGKTLVHETLDGQDYAVKQCK